MFGNKRRRQAREVKRQEEQAQMMLLEQRSPWAFKFIFSSRMVRIVCMDRPKHDKLYCIVQSTSEGCFVGCAEYNKGFNRWRVRLGSDVTTVIDMGPTDLYYELDWLW